VTVALLIYAAIMTVGFAGIAYPRTRRLFLTAPPKEEPKLLAASAGSPLAEWKTIFRDTAVEPKKHRLTNAMPGVKCNVCEQQIWIFGPKYCLDCKRAFCAACLTETCEAVS